MTAAQRAAAKAARRQENRDRWASRQLNARQSAAEAVSMPEIAAAATGATALATGFADLVAIMRDTKIEMRQRINSAISASRVAPIAQPGAPAPEPITFLRWIIDNDEFNPQYRRECAAALAYYQRRAAKAALQFAIPDQDERREKWRRILNGLIRHHLWKRGLWPDRKDVLIGLSDTFDTPLGDPDRALSAILLPPATTRQQRRRRAIDDPGGLPIIGTEQERMDVLEQFAVPVHRRLAEFGLAPPRHAKGGLDDGLSARASP